METVARKFFISFAALLMLLVVVRVGCKNTPAKSLRIHGIDVSHYQQNIDWRVVKNYHVDFVFVKATEGYEHEDTKFYENWKAIKDAGLFRGAYHFLNLKKDGKKQAENFLNTVRLGSGDLPPVLDIEYSRNMPSTAKIREVAQVWLNRVEKHYQVKPIIYTSKTFYNDYLAGHFDDYPLWISYYNKNAPKLKDNASYILWQYTDKGVVEGIPHKVDLNYFYGSIQDMKNLCIP